MESPNATMATAGGCPWERLLRAAFVLVALAVLSVALRPEARMPVTPVSEDAFYALAVSRHIALGNGITIDGEQWTNGFQPLSTFAMVPAFWIVEDRMLALRLVILLQGLVAIGSALLFARLAAGPPRSVAHWTAALAWLGSFHLLQHNLNGLETGLALLLYLACWWAWRAGSAAMVGVAAGALVLARIDAALFAALLGAAMLLREGSPSRGAKGFLLVGAISAGMAAPWFAYNLWLHGHIIPSSGLQSFEYEDFPVLRLMGLDALVANAAPWLSAGQLEVAWGRRVERFPIEFTLVRLAVLAALGWLAVKAAGGWRRPGRDGAFIALLAVHAAALAAFYSWKSGTWWFYPRYMAPMVIPGLWLLARALGGLRRPALAAAPGIAFAASGLLLAACFWTGWGFGRVFVHHTYWPEQVGLVADHVPPGDLVGGQQTGTLGFFRDRVVNLDGKVNFEALAHRRALIDYMEELGIRWMCDWPGWTPFVEHPSGGMPWWEKVEQRGHFGLWRRTEVPLPPPGAERDRAVEEWLAAQAAEESPPAQAAEESPRAQAAEESPPAQAPGEAP